MVGPTKEVGDDPLDDNHPTKNTWRAEATSPLEAKRLKNERPTPPTLLQCLRGGERSAQVPIIQVTKVTNNLRDHP